MHDPTLASSTMSLISGGTFLMGSDDFYPEEGPAHRVTVSAFRIDRHPVTNADFRTFIETTGYVTVAERPLDKAAYPGASAELLVPGALVFVQPRRRVDLRNWTQWWDYVPGASWRRPRGPGTSIEGRANHPVVQVAYEDAAAYAAWAGKALPTEAEWEIAARGGLEGAPFIWGSELTRDGTPMANTWRGEFPWENLKPSVDHGTSPVGSYPANGFGLYDMAGNVWEWTCDWYRAAHGIGTSKPCCLLSDPRGASVEESLDPGMPQIRMGRKVLKGGSHLCSANYCFRYRPAARIPQMIDTASCHVGFRCILRGTGD